MCAIRSTIHSESVQYFETMNSLNDNNEPRGVQISAYETTAVNSVREEHNRSCKQCCAVQ